LRSATSHEVRHALATELSLQMQASLPAIQELSFVDKNTWIEDHISRRLLQIRNPTLLDRYVPIQTTGDSNCLFRAVSRLRYGTELHHARLRLMCACEVILHPDTYDRSSSSMYPPFKDSRYLVIPCLQEVLDEILRIGSTDRGYAGVVVILALSSIIAAPITMVYPLTSADGLYDEYSQTVFGRDVDVNKESYSVMWTTARDEQFTISTEICVNHFIALLKHELGMKNLFLIINLKEFLFTCVTCDSHDSRTIINLVLL
jgi:hypothetical protein